MGAKNTKKSDAPTLCTRRSESGTLLCFARFNGKQVSFGPAGPEGQRRYDEALAKWLANGRRLDDVDASDDGGDYRVDELVGDYLAHARTFYVDASTGAPNGEYLNMRAALSPVLERFRDLPAAKFGPVALRAVRDAMVDSGKLCRKEINNRVHRIRRAWRWAASMEKVPAGVVEALATVDGLRMGKTTARESDRVLPVEDADVHEVTAHLCPTVAAMVWLGYWTGARPGEVCALRWSMIDRAGKTWVAVLEKHKTAWRGRQRRINIGPNAQNALMPLLRPGPDAFVFSPQRAIAEQREAKRTRRKTKVQPSQVARAARAKKTPESFAESFDVSTFRTAITRGVRLANAARIRRQLLVTIAELDGGTLSDAVRDRIEALPTKALTNGSGGLRLRESSLRAFASGDVAAKEIAEACAAVPLIESWAPNRLRHSAATRLRREEGIEAARVVLGHARAAVTEVYAEVDHERARAIMARHG